MFAGTKLIETVRFTSSVRQSIGTPSQTQIKTSALPAQLPLSTGKKDVPVSDMDR